jgi:serine protease AprX
VFRPRSSRNPRHRARRRIAAYGAALVGIGVLVSTAASAVVVTPLGYDAVKDAGSMQLIAKSTGAQAMWNAGFTGKGIDVAVIDTGVARVPGLNQTGKVIDGVDVSFDSQTPALAYNDGFGHGTIMASIIAGSDVAAGSAKSAFSDPTKFVGIAPEARIINVKAGAADGAVDISQMIAAINWVTEHKTDNGMNIRVLNLSFGSDTPQAAAIDPLVFAAEAAWKKGIVVVASSGNDGLSRVLYLANPAASRAIIAVGASDTSGTSAITDDFVPAFAQHGTPLRPVDVIAPGDHVLGLKVPGSFIDQSVTTGKVGSRFQRGSGTSQAAAVVSGLAALIVQKFPSATPGQVKKMLTDSAQSIHPATGFLATLYDSWYEGSGEANMSGVVSLKKVPAADVVSEWSDGSGSLNAARGSAHVVSNGVALTGEVDIMGQPWNPAAWVAATNAGTTWSGGTWNGYKWAGDGWFGYKWAGYKWAGADWSGTSWSSVKWAGTTWDGYKWAGASWAGYKWADASWSGYKWAGSAWS